MRYAQTFQALKTTHKPAFVPFVTLGDPSYDLSFGIVKTLIDAGVSALELGFAFSDPIADGPVIQEGNLRALRRANMAANFELLERVRNLAPNIPIGLLVYANLIVRFGVDRFYAACAKSGVDSVLVADVPLRESAEFIKAAHQHAIAPVFLATPNASPKHLEHIAKNCPAFVYVLARAGVTGTQEHLATTPQHILHTLKKISPTPCLLGFGISQPSHVTSALSMGADGVICGSAIVQIIAQNLEHPPSMLARLREFVAQMVGES
ncbi:Tryptophan synthase alpha chain [Helicobacter bizzozeronii CCUG 35545]|nr:Tryptophan synthase alpha chain [Helicobacter bizzozeronii CCUG 35545]